MTTFTTRSPLTLDPTTRAPRADAADRDALDLALLAAAMAGQVPVDDPRVLSSLHRLARAGGPIERGVIDEALRAWLEQLLLVANTPVRAAPDHEALLRALRSTDRAPVARAPHSAAPRPANRAPQDSVPQNSVPLPTLPNPGAQPPARAAAAVGARAAMTQAEKFDHYRGLIEAQGGRFDPRGKNVISVRTPTNARANGGNGVYDDVTAVLSLGPGGEKRVQEFRSNTEPSARYAGKMGVDVNRDGRLDQGRLRAGAYVYEATTFRGGPAFAMRGDSIVDRDTNRDGTFGNDGGARSRGGASMLWHVGGRSITGSAGCQTMPPDEYRRFLAALGGARSFRYTLVER